MHTAASRVVIDGPWMNSGLMEKTSVLQLRKSALTYSTISIKNVIIGAMQEWCANPVSDEKQNHKTEIQQHEVAS